MKIEPQQDLDEDLHYIWLYEGPQWKQKLYAAGALAAIMAVVMFPLWPIKLRLGVWYLSMGVLGLIGLFTLMSIFRLILFCVTYFAIPPGLWLYPNLFEDVGFFDSFKPFWGWQEVGSRSLFTLSQSLLNPRLSLSLSLPSEYDWNWNKSNYTVLQNIGEEKEEEIERCIGYIAETISYLW